MTLADCVFNHLLTKLLKQLNESLPNAYAGSQLDSCPSSVLALLSLAPLNLCSCSLYTRAYTHTQAHTDICILRLELAFSGAQIPLLFMLVPWTGFSCAAPLSIVCSFLLHTPGLAWIVNSPLVSPSSLPPSGQSTAMLRRLRKRPTKKHNCNFCTELYCLASSLPPLLLVLVRLLPFASFPLAWLFFRHGSALALIKYWLRSALRFYSNAPHACQSCTSTPPPFAVSLSLSLF